MNIFGGNTGMTYEDLQRKRAIADRLIAQNASGASKNVGEGLGAIGRALAAKVIEKRVSKRDAELQAEADQQWQSVFGDYSTPSQPQAFAAPAVSTTNIEGKAVADDTMRALGREPIGMPADVQAKIFAGESGGDYDAVFGYQQRPGGQFEGVKPTEMSVEQVLQFQDPSGPYGQFVKGQVGRVATPVGAYQIVGATLRDAVKAGVVSPNEQFTPEVQDRVGNWILQTQGTGAWEGYNRGGGGSGGGMPQRIASTQAIAEALSNPYIRKDPGKVAILQALLQQNLAPPTPQYRMASGAELGLGGDMANAYFNVSPDGKLTQIGGGGTNVTVNNAGETAPQIGTIPQGFVAIEDPNSDAGYRMVQIPGGPADSTAQDEQNRVNRERSGGVVTEDINAALKIIQEDPNWATGFGSILSVVPGTQAKSLSGLLQTIKANVGFDRLQQMRDASITGGALGAINKTEMDLLQSVLGNLDQSLDAEDLARNLRRVNEVYLDIIHGPGNRPANVPDFDAFAADPENQAAAEKYGVTLEEMYDFMRSQNQ